jgi:hypothetical protein
MDANERLNTALINQLKLQELIDPISVSFIIVWPPCKLYFADTPRIYIYILYCKAFIPLRIYICIKDIISANDIVNTDEDAGLYGSKALR